MGCCGGHVTKTVTKAFSKTYENNKSRNFGYRKGPDGKWYGPGTQDEASLEPERKSKAQLKRESQRKSSVFARHKSPSSLGTLAMMHGTRSISGSSQLYGQPRSYGKSQSFSKSKTRSQRRDSWF
ncbi:uncharacterized protein BKA55DRAFT_690565 [Fusarium redolens]|uniref:Uncharacterized protein n=1 Tax=Fusarium redolens TaxID=48865 RepID=A0A9P9KAR5_FUSRE|nr:uncharacterized protein BKA55DRAFT_690565 [Fusarium redolens]KAH7250331.1 hypothetical protein BKA55DRAFT_690565 [Fusarium redolens]